MTLPEVMRPRGAAPASGQQRHWTPLVACCCVSGQSCSSASTWFYLYLQGWHRVSLAAWIASLAFALDVPNLGDFRSKGETIDLVDVRLWPMAPTLGCPREDSFQSRGVGVLLCAIWPRNRLDVASNNVLLYFRQCPQCAPHPNDPTTAVEHNECEHRSSPIPAPGCASGWSVQLLKTLCTLLLPLWLERPRCES